MPGPGPTTQNSSPPQRATTSVARVTSRSASATATITSSPESLPSCGVDLLEPGDLDEDAVRGVALAPGQLDDLRPDHRQPATVGQTGELVAHGGRVGRVRCGRELADRTSDEGG